MTKLKYTSPTSEVIVLQPETPLLSASKISTTSLDVDDSGKSSRYDWSDDDDDFWDE